MAEVKFPQKRDDGSFTVSALFSMSDENVLAPLREYLKAWMRANKTWRRVWRSDSIFEEQLEFSSEFSAEPRVETGTEKLRFAIVLDGKPSATRWKDWLVLLTDDLCKVFPEIKFDRFKS